MTRIDELKAKFRKTGHLDVWEGLELMTKLDIMQEFVEKLASGEKYYYEDVYYDAKAILNKM